MDSFQLELQQECDDCDLLATKFNKFQFQRIIIPSKDFSTTSLKSLNLLKEKDLKFRSINYCKSLTKKINVITEKCIQPNFFAEFSQTKLNERQLANFVRLNLQNCESNFKKK